MIYDVIKKSRSYRRFYQDRSIPENTLRDLVELARLSPSAANLQPLKFVLSYTPDRNSLIFPCLAWAGYLKDWDGPKEGERPSAYIMILGDTGITSNFSVNHGIAAQSILLGATEMGYGGCIIGSIQREKLRTQLAIPQHLEILLVIALGVPKETVILEEVRDGDIKYWRDKDGVHHVPKRSLSDLILDL
ncbi:MAG: nitroreductase A [Syntrophorhabdus sp. PtaU1.Bin058]|nr:MAG: nitroreductase A [Syntrophorhabdus sp. PtaU1.Bin058]